jgi:hypothetical protein
MCFVLFHPVSSSDDPPLKWGMVSLSAENIVREPERLKANSPGQRPGERKVIRI